ncbi:Structural maintenance of chromosomes protein 5 [Nowakowskiella sp. JEL0407]|nr:Structural maintenance of chromosomes protein 5 [Nowakowskiella sp. JEL0407]
MKAAKRKSQVVDSDEEEDALSEQEQEDSPDDQRPSPDPEAPEAPARKKLKENIGAHNFGPSKLSGGYCEGAIVRVKLQNFVTYDSLEFYPGPNLNMIIGPNGTGKSTIVCAIALGLGGTPNLLGRQKEIQDFIKSGKKNGSVEIELKGKKKNLVLKRDFMLGSNKNTWKINGQDVTLEAVKKNISGLDIQVDNLCQFLPQDKVSEFAHMDAQKLLHETMRAADPTEMPKQFNLLCDFRRKEKSASAVIEAIRTDLETNIARNKTLESDLALFRQREKILLQIRKLKLTIPFAKFNQSQEELKEFKQKAQEAADNMTRLEMLSQPDKKELEKLEKVAKECDESEKVGKKKYAEITRGIEKKCEEVTGADDKINNLKARVDANEKKENELRKRVGQLQTIIEKMKSDSEELKRTLMEKGVLDKDGKFSSGESQDSELGDIERKMKDLTQCIREKNTAVSTIRRKMAELQDTARTVRREYDTYVNESNQLVDPKSQKLDALKRFDYNAYKAYMWLQENRDKFEKEVIGPVLLEINVPNQEYAQAVEEMLPRGTMLNFVAQTRGDYQKFTEVARNELKVRVSVTWLAEGKEKLDAWPRLSNELVKPDILFFDCRFDGIVLDYVQASETVLSFLCQSASSHTKAITLREGPDLRTLDNSKFNDFIVGNTHYNVRSAYGSSSTRATVLKPVNFLGTNIDVGARERIEAKIRDAEARLKAIQGEIKGIEGESKEAEKEAKLLQDQKNELNDRKKELLKDKLKYEKGLGEILAREANLSTAQGNLAAIPAETAKLRTEVEKLIELRIRKVSELLKIQKAATEAHLARVKSVIASTTAQASVEIKKKQMEENSAQLSEYRRIALNAKDIYNEKKRINDTLKEEARKAASQMTPEDKDFAQEYRKKPVEELELELVEQTARADAAMGGYNPGVVEEYTRREEEIARMREELEGKEAELENSRANVRSVKERWYSKLTDLVARINKGFSDAFERIGCTGEVKLHEEPDYDQWGIHILSKKHRDSDSEKLQQLTAQRQSGGERSVSTIMYLMALQELSRSPFRVVDEINQGMDPRNERLVHSQLVEVACKPNTPQYFLITPKLLADLEYHENMRILTIYSGDWTPKSIPYPPGLTARS